MTRQCLVKVTSMHVHGHHVIICRPPKESFALMRNGIFLIILLYSNYAYSQQSECIVMVKEISGSYSGGCKDGLADGKGIASGKDSYEGQFKNGLPHGKGTYKWSNGDYYEGQWQDGRKEGKGKMVYSDSTLTGYWSAGEYKGKVFVPPYSITRSRNVARSSITKKPGTSNDIQIKILQSGTNNSFIENYSMSCSSGATYATGDPGGYGIQDVFIPFEAQIKYIAWNKLRTVQYEVIFDFKINEPGSWLVIINN
jgi:hypothetical protein